MELGVGWAFGVHVSVSVTARLACIALHLRQTSSFLQHGHDGTKYLWLFVRFVGGTVGQCFDDVYIYLSNALIELNVTFFVESA